MKDKRGDVNELEVDFGDIIANLKLLSQNLLHINEYGKGVSITNPFMTCIFNDYIAPAVESLLKGIEAMEKISVQTEKEAEKTNAELLVEAFKDIATKYSEEDIDNAVALLKAETETANEILRKIMVGKKWKQTTL